MEKSIDSLYKKIQYNYSLLKEKEYLERRLVEVNKGIYHIQNECDHIKVCIGWNGPYLYRDTSICKCLLCGEDEPESKYPVIEAYDYRSDLFSHGEIASYRKERMIELQNLAMSIISKKEDITVEQLVEIMRDIIKNPIASKYANLALACLQYPEVQLVQPNEERVQKQIDSLMPWINEDIDDGLDFEQTKKYHVGIVSGPTFMSQFINKLKSGELKIEICPQVEVGTELTEEYIIEQLESYQRLLDSGIIDEATKEEQGSVKKLVPNKKK